MSDYEQINGVTYERNPDGRLALPKAASPAALDVFDNLLRHHNATCPNGWTCEFARQAAAHLSRSAGKQGPPHENCSCVNCEGTPFDPPPWKRRLSQSAGEQK